MSSRPWPLCLSYQGKRSVVQAPDKKNETTAAPAVNDNDASCPWSLPLLIQAATKEFGLSSADVNITFQTGFPPKPIILKGNDDDDGWRQLLPPRQLVHVVVEQTNTSSNGPAKKKQKRSTNSTASSSNIKKTSTATVMKSKKRKAAAAVAAPSSDYSGNEDNCTTSAVKPASSPRRQRRAAAQRATDNFAQVIRAQDELMRQQQPQKQKQQRHVTSSTTSRKKSCGGSKTSRTSRSFPAVTGPGRRLDSNPQQHEGGVVASLSSSRHSNASPRKIKSPSTNKKYWSSKEDVSVSLLSSMGGSGSNNNKVGHVLRGAMRRAMASVEEAKRARVRLEATYSHQYTITTTTTTTRTTANDDGDDDDNNNNNSTNDDDNPALMLLQVEFSKGIEGRGVYREEYQCIPRDALVAVVEHVYQQESLNNDDENDEATPMTAQELATSGKEMLRPNHLSHVSPRVFWNVLYWYEKQQQHGNDNDNTRTATATTTVEQALAALAPHLDWTYLHRGRVKTLSEKARENLRQKQEDMKKQRKRRRQGGDGNSDENQEDDWDRGEAAIEAVQQAMGNAVSSSGNNVMTQEERRRVAEAAALARRNHDNCTAAAGTPSVHPQTAPTPVKKWIIVTPTDLDEDELRECILEGHQQQRRQDENYSNCISLDPNQVNKWISVLTNECGVHNWRELANVSSDDESLLQKLGMTTAAAAFRCSSKDVVESWLDAAQARSVDEIMLELLSEEEVENEPSLSNSNNNQDYLQLLTDKARAGTPKDLAAYQAIPEILWQYLLDSPTSSSANGSGARVGDSTTANTMEEEKQQRRSLPTLSLAQVRTWCQRAHEAMEQFEWLAWYATPVGGNDSDDI